MVASFEKTSSPAVEAKVKTPAEGGLEREFASDEMAFPKLAAFPRKNTHEKKLKKITVWEPLFYADFKEKISVLAVAKKNLFLAPPPTNKK